MKKAPITLRDGATYDPSTDTLEVEGAFYGLGFLARAARLLKDGGRLLWSLDDAGAVTFTVLQGENPFPGPDPEGGA